MLLYMFPLPYFNTALYWPCFCFYAMTHDFSFFFVNLVVVGCKVAAANRNDPLNGDVDVRTYGDPVTDVVEEHDASLDGDFVTDVVVDAKLVGVVEDFDPSLYGDPDTDVVADADDGLVTDLLGDVVEELEPRLYVTDVVEDFDVRSDGDLVMDLVAGVGARVAGDFVTDTVEDVTLYWELTDAMEDLDARLCGDLVTDVVYDAARTGGNPVVVAAFVVAFDASLDGDVIPVAADTDAVSGGADVTIVGAAG